jgi:DNA mismatch repair protein MutS2
MKLAPALEALQRQLDAAVLAGLSSFAVIHGKGGGVLQEGVHNYLRADTRVADFAFARPEEGGTGKTHVRLRE